MAQINRINFSPPNTLLTLPHSFDPSPDHTSLCTEGTHLLPMCFLLLETPHRKPKRFHPLRIQRASSCPQPPVKNQESVARKLKSASPKDSCVSKDDTKSMVNMKRERYRRHSIGGSFVRDDESLVGSPSFPSYMIPTQSAKAKTRIQSPLATENGTSDNNSVGTAKKRLSFPPSPARPRLHPVPTKLESSLNSEISVGNGIGH